MSRTSVSRLASAFAMAGVLAACAETPTTSAPAASSELAPQEAPAYSLGASEQIIPGRFIVTLRPGTNAAAVAREHGVQPDFVYSAALDGFAGSVADAARAGLLRDFRVVRVERDGIATTQGVQTGATWGLDRTDQRSLPLNSTYSYNNTGSGVRAYILDTGIRSTHTEFGGRVVQGHSSITDKRGTSDCNGHGTHVAGTVGGNVYGVAKGVTLVPVRVLDCRGSGSWSGIIAGIDWIVADHADKGGPAVANMSLGGGANSTVDDAVKEMIAAGVATGVSAGNGDRWGRPLLACNQSPARVAAAMTIAATNSSDAKTSWSNYGTCVDMFAPGASITSAWYNNDGATNTISGTSMATPHVVGVAALYLQSNPGAGPSAVAGALAANASTGKVTNPGSGSPNLLLYSSY
jgi:subtilisin family serine protease